MFNQNQTKDNEAGQKHPGGLSSQGPDWLEDGPAPTAPQTSQTAERPGIRQIDEKLPPLPKLVTLMRFANIVLCCLIAVICVLKMLTVDDMTTAIIAVYLIMFSMMVTCFELQLKIIVQKIGSNFGFLYNAKGRALFFLFIGILTFSIGFWGIVLGALMLANALFNFYIIYKYPQFEEMALRTLEEETSAYLKNNPELVAKGVAAVAKTTLEAQNQQQTSSSQAGVV